MPRVTAALLGALLLSGCASGRTRRETAAALAAADARVLEGCYDCLLQARAGYERLGGASRGTAADTVALRLFETDLLIALREKELALDWAPAIARATALAPRLGPAIDAARLLRAVDAVLPDAIGIPLRTFDALRRARVSQVASVADEIAWIRQAPLRPVVRDYVALSLDCAYPMRPRSAGSLAAYPRKRPGLPPGASPIIVYRTGICAPTDTTLLADSTRAPGTFPETAYYLGSAAAFGADVTGGADAARLLAAAAARFPRSPGVAFMSGWLASVVGDCAAAVRHFEATLAIHPAHDNAMLQRTICLSTMRHDTAAIASATQLIALEAETMEQGYYWRALSRHRLKELPAARADINFAKTRARAANVLTLAGVIEHDQDDLPVAEKDLREARELFRGEENCTAAWYLALVLSKGGARAREAAEQFEAAMTCYDLKVADLRWKIGKLQETAALYPAFTARKIAALAADSADQRTRYFAAAFNGAGNQANAGNIPRALQLLDVAGADPRLGKQVSEMRGAIAARRSR